MNSPKAETKSNRRWEFFPVFCTAFVGMYVLPFNVGGPPTHSERVPMVTDTPPHLSALGGTIEQLDKADRYSLERIVNREDHAPLAEGMSESEKAPSLPIPIRSHLLVSKGNLGGVNAWFQVYESWGSASAVSESLVEDYMSTGWNRNRKLEILARPEIPGVLLSFVRGHERALLHIGRVPETGKIETLVIYIEKSWLPEESGF